MKIKDVSLKIESLFRFINHDEQQYTSAIELHPCEEILFILTKAKKIYPGKADVIQFYIERYKNMGDKSLRTLFEDGYDIGGLAVDMERLKKELKK